MVEKKLEQLIKTLEEEKNLIIRAIEAQEYIEKLIKVIEEKQKLLEQIKNLSPEEIKNYKDKIEEIKKLSQVNMSLALDNLQFIEEVFSVIFKNEAKQYNQSGHIQENQKSLFNKKI